MLCICHCWTLKEIYERCDFLLTFLDVKNSMPLATWYEKLRRSSVSRDRLSSSNISLSECASTYWLPVSENKKLNNFFYFVRKRKFWIWLHLCFNTGRFAQWLACLPLRSDRFLSEEELDGRVPAADGLMVM